MYLKSTALLCTLLAAPAAAQQMVQVTADRDNTLYFSSSGSTSNGAGTRMFVGAAGSGSERRAVFHFDLAGVVPAGATVTAVTLDLRVEGTATLPPPTTDHGLHRLVADWGEGASVAGSGQGGGGAAAAGDATWLHRFSPNVFWTSPGGDFAPAASATYPAPTSGALSVSSAMMAADVQTWVDDPSTNHGWLLRAVTPSAAARIITARESASAANRPRLSVTFVPPPIVAYCAPGAPNSTGAPGVLGASGSASVAANDLTLQASGLPLSATTFFITSLTQGYVANPGGSAGNLCLGGSIGRYVGPGQVQNTGTSGAAGLLLDLTQHPTPIGLIQVMPGETWNFQAWHRDSTPGGPATSNFTHGLSVTFS